MDDGAEHAHHLARFGLRIMGEIEAVLDRDGLTEANRESLVRQMEHFDRALGRAMARLRDRQSQQQRAGG